jgi:hypothetical protein
MPNAKTTVRWSLIILGFWSVPVVLAIPVLGAAPATTDAALAEVVLPSETCRGVFFVPVTFGEGEGTTLELLLDTGASRTYLDSGALRSLLGRDVGYGKTSLANARIGPFEIGTLQAHILRLHTVSLALGRNVDGIIGYPVFRDVLLTLDYPAEQIRVSHGRLPRPDGREIFPYRGFRRPHLDAEVGGRRTKVLLDSGATGRFALLPTKNLAWSVEPRPMKTSVGVGHVTVREGGRLADAIQFGPLRFEAPVVTLIGDESLVGWHVLRYFVLTFDQKQKRIRMQTHGTDPIRLASWVGMGAGFYPRSEGLEILEVFADTSAEAAGLRTGDLIVAIDGTPVHDLGCSDPLGDPAGRRKVLTYIRDGIQAEAEIETEALIP